MMQNGMIFPVKNTSVIYFTKNTSKIKCIGNKFIDNYGYPIGCNCVIDMTKIELQNNNLIGFNGINGNKEVNDANKCYFCDDKVTVRGSFSYDIHDDYI